MGRQYRAVLLGAGLLAAALGGAGVSRLFSSGEQPSAEQPARPIVQIVRQQPGLPDLSDLIDSLCPSIAMVVPHGVSAGPSSASAQPVIPALVFSRDGWLVVPSVGLPQGPLDALFGDGRRVQLTDIRIDPVSGIAILKSADAVASPLQFDDQAFPRVGQFGFTLATQYGAGCSASAAMIGSDFLADGDDGPAGYVRLRPAPDDWSAGMPVLGTDGRLMGIGLADPAGAVIPAPVVSVILGELVRNSLSSSTSFGFRAIDYPEPLLARLGDVRAGAGVALVQPKSPAARAGLQVGDIVTAVADTPVSSASELSRALGSASGSVTLTIQRQAQPLQITLKPTSKR